MDGIGPRSGQGTVEDITARLTQTCAVDPRNRLREYGFRIWAQPLVGVAAAADPLFSRFKQPAVIGPQYLGPEEWLPGAKSVVSYFLPATEEVRRPNRRPGMVAPEWVAARFEGEEFNEVLRDLLAGWLGQMGGRAVVPCHTPRYQVVNQRANWSERHAAYAAGLGTFGLSKSLITAYGSAGRFGSVVTDLELPPTPRPYSGPFERCPYLSSGGCGACIARCPSGAIKPEGKDIAVCGSYLYEVVRAAYASRHGSPGDPRACGKCQTAVPCEAAIPGPEAGGAAGGATRGGGGTIGGGDGGIGYRAGESSAR